MRGCCANRSSEIPEPYRVWIDGSVVARCSRDFWIRLRVVNFQVQMWAMLCYVRAIGVHIQSCDISYAFSRGCRLKLKTAVDLTNARSITDKVSSAVDFGSVGSQNTNRWLSGRPSNESVICRTANAREPCLSPISNRTVRCRMQCSAGSPARESKTK